MQGELIFDKGAENIQLVKNGLFNNWWENCISTCKRMKLGPSLTPHAKINLKWIKDLSARPKTTKLLEENKGKTA